MPLTRWRRRACSFLLASGLLAGGVAAAAPGNPALAGPGLHEGVRFGEYAPHAGAPVLVQRLIAPTSAARLVHFATSSGVTVSRHSVDLAQERFDLFVPAMRPAAGYGLIVFVSPMPDFSLPRSWRRELDERGIAFVTARDSGNDANVLERRIPLALHGWHNVDRLLPLDPARVYVAGFSGGARVAQRLAQAYPEVFRGALLFGSSDPYGVPGVLGEAPLSPPRAQHMQLFRERSRVLLVTGSQDLPNRARASRTADSLTEYCVAHVEMITIPRLGHWVPEGHRFAEVLEVLEQPPGTTGALHACERRLGRRIEAGLSQVERLLVAGRAREAGVALGEVEDAFGGLAAPRSVELARRVAAALDPGGG